MSSFSGDPNFCSMCGTILSMKSGSARLTCINCGHLTDLSEMRHVPKKSRVYLNTPSTVSSVEEKEVGSGRNDGPIADRRCRKCDHQGLAYLTLQLRSADEGQTVIYTCPKCGLLLGPYEIELTENEKGLMSGVRRLFATMHAHHEIFVFMQRSSIIDVYAANASENLAKPETEDLILFQIAQFHFEPGETSWLTKKLSFSSPVLTRWARVSCRYYRPCPNNLYNQVGIKALEFYGSKVGRAGYTDQSRGATVFFFERRWYSSNRTPFQTFVLSQTEGQRGTGLLAGEGTATRFSSYPDPVGAGYFRNLPALARQPQEVRVAALLNQLDNHKRKAVEGEDFEGAAYAKTIHEEITKIASQIQELETKKEGALTEEDYAGADRFKMQILRLTVDAMYYLKAHKFASFFEKDQLKAMEDTLRKRKSLGVPAAPADVQSSARTAVDKPNLITKMSEERARKSSPPEPRQGRKQGHIKEQRPAGVSGPRNDLHNAKAKKGKPKAEDHPDLQYALVVFGEEVVDLSRSAGFKDRTQVLEIVNGKLDMLTTEGSGESSVAVIIRASLALMDKMIKEDAMIIQLVAQTLLRILRDVMPNFPEVQSDIFTFTESALSFGFARLGSTNRRITQVVLPFITELALIDDSRTTQLVVRTCLEPLKPSAQARYSLGRARIVQDLLIRARELENNISTTELFIRFAVSAMEHHDREVRQKGEEIVIWLYNGHIDDRKPQTSEQQAEHREAVRGLLPQPPVDADKARRNFKYRHLLQVLQEIDQGNRRNVPRHEPRLVFHCVARGHLPSASEISELPCPAEEKTMLQVPGGYSTTSGQSAHSRSVLTSAIEPAAPSRRPLSPVSDHSQVSRTQDASYVHSVYPSGVPSNSESTQEPSLSSLTVTEKEHVQPHENLYRAYVWPVDRGLAPALSQAPSEVRQEEHGIEGYGNNPDNVARKIIPLQKNGKFWSHLKLIGDYLEKDGYDLVDRGFNHSAALLLPNFVSSCLFCGKPSVGKNLNKHLYHECPMLKQCDLCKQKTVISDLTRHQLGSCEKSRLMSRCTRCGIAVPTKKLQSHLKQRQCVDVSEKSDVVVCPLCNQGLPNSVDGWVEHLLAEEIGCRKNKRRVKALKWTQAEDTEHLQETSSGYGSS